MVDCSRCLALPPALEQTLSLPARHFAQSMEQQIAEKQAQVDALVQEEEEQAVLTRRLQVSARAPTSLGSRLVGRP